MKKSLVLVVCVLFCLPLLVVLESGCGDRGSKQQSFYAPSPTASFETEETAKLDKTSDDMPASSGDTRGTNDDIQTLERKIIYSGSITVEVKEHDKAADDFSKLLEKYKDFVYIHSSNTYIQYEKYQTTNYVIKINPEKLNEFIGEISKLGDVTSQSIRGEDITETYVDLKSRLENKEKTLIRLNALLETKTNKLNDLLQVEREIERVAGDIEVLKGKIRYYDNLVGMATLEVSLNEKIPKSYHRFEFGESFKEAVVNSLWAGWSVILFFITISIPTIIIVLVFWLIIWIIIKIIKKSIKKKEV
ncbi:MAG: DUF4349 domain-containing protein [bacterium]|nr:DUF4349 domain-containing protein [bacterium]